MIDRQNRMKSIVRALGTLAVLALLLAGWSGAAAAPTAEEAAIDGVWSMGIVASTEGGGLTIGAHFTVTTEGGDYIGECTLPLVKSSVPSYNCRVNVPSDKISLVWEDLDSIPAGYAPVENPIAFDPTTYETGPHNIGAWFHNVPSSTDDPSSLVNEIVRILIQILAEVLQGGKA